MNSLCLLLQVMWIVEHPIERLINKADTAINKEDFDTLIDIYADDAVLVIQPGMNAVGKEQIRKAFEAIAALSLYVQGRLRADAIRTSEGIERIKVKISKS